jgi:hypothetical protein
MNVQAGATVGFMTALGGLAGAFAGAMLGGLLDSKNSTMTTFGAGAGALAGAFIGGTIVTTAPIAPAVGTAGVPPQLAP